MCEVGTATLWNAGLTCVANGSRPSPLPQLAGRLVRYFLMLQPSPRPAYHGAENGGGSPQSHAPNGPRQGLNRCRKPACTGAANDEPEPISTRLKQCRSFSDALP